MKPDRASGAAGRVIDGAASKGITFFLAARRYIRRTRASSMRSVPAVASSLQKKLSATALSLQSPTRLMLQTIPRATSSER